MKTVSAKISAPLNTPSHLDQSLTSAIFTPLPQPPPVVMQNPHRLILPEQVPFPKAWSPPVILPKEKDLALLWCSHLRHQPKKPLCPIQLTWHPEQLHIELDYETHYVSNIWICNRSCVSLFVHVSSLWNRDARAGAWWKCIPRTTSFLAPGLSQKVVLEAIPHETSPLRTVDMGIQLAAGVHLDTVVEHFFVPIHVTFNNYYEAAAIPEGASSYCYEQSPTLSIGDPVTP